MKYLLIIPILFLSACRENPNGAIIAPPFEPKCYYIINFYSGGIMVNSYTTDKYNSGSNASYVSFIDKTTKNRMEIYGDFTVEERKYTDK